MRKLLFTAVLVWTVSTVYSQSRGRVYSSLFPEFGKYHPRGWILAPSLNYMLPHFKNAHDRLWTESKEVYDVEYHARGKVGVGIEFGRFHVIDGSRLISHISLIMGLKHLRGVERFEATLDDPTRENPLLRRGEGVFSHTYATMSFDVSNAHRLSRHTFLENTLGINGDFRVMEDLQYSKQSLPIDLEQPTRFIFQAHYRLGFGMKIAQNIMLIPSLETPIVTFYEYDDLKSTLAVLNSRYRPFIFRVQVLIMDRRASRTCPPKNPNRKRSEGLFGMNHSSPW